MAYGSALREDPDRFGEVTALEFDEVLFVRVGTYRTATFSRRNTTMGTRQRLTFPPPAGHLVMQLAVG